MHPMVEEDNSPFMLKDDLAFHEPLGDGDGDRAEVDAGGIVDAGALVDAGDIVEPVAGPPA